MKTLSTLLRPLLAGALLCAPLLACTAEDAGDAPVAGLEAGKDYARVLPAQPTGVPPGSVEVLEFFWYGCPHCYQAEPHIERWLESRPENVVFTRVPATVNRGWLPMAQAYYTAEQLGVTDAMHPALFAAWHETRRPLATAEEIAALFQEVAGVEPAAFMAAFNSMAVNSRVQQADVLARRYRIDGVPTMAVNGRFSTNPTRAGGYARMLEIVEALVQHERQAAAN